LTITFGRIPEHQNRNIRESGKDLPFSSAWITDFRLRPPSTPKNFVWWSKPEEFRKSAVLAALSFCSSRADTIRYRVLRVPQATFRIKLLVVPSPPSRREPDLVTVLLKVVLMAKELY
jgi:hypothetical protein